MKAYAKNSPEAISRILAMMMITDAKLDDREIEIMDQLRILDIIGISRSGFSQVVQDYCSELLGGGTRDGKIRLVDKDRINEIVDLVDDPKKRVDTCGMILNIANADGKIHDTELAVFGYILERWGMTLESLEHDLTSAAEKRDSKDGDRHGVTGKACHWRGDGHASLSRLAAITPLLSLMHCRRLDGRSLR